MNESTSQFEDWFQAAESATLDARAESERARDYVDGKQLTAEEISTLKARGQPPVVMNRIRRKVEWLKGLEVKQRTDPKAFPRTPQDQDDAQSVTDAIRFVTDDQDWDEIRSEVYDDFLVEGFGACEVVHAEGRQGQVDVEINYYPWDRLFYDPHSRKPDFSDARYKGVVVWLDDEDFRAEYPDFRGHLESLYSATNTETYDDRPADIWVDPKRKRVRVILMWYRKKSVWHWCQFVRGQKIDGGESPYQDEDGRSVCPLIMIASHVGRQNERHGIVRDMFDAQDEINKRRSKALHSINSRQTIGIKGAVDSVVSLKAELAKPDGHVELNAESFDDAGRVGMKPFEVIPTNDQAAGQMALLQEAKAEIDMLGANSALEGEVGESTSGRAVLARQQGGMIEIAALNDRFHRFTRQVYRHIWMRIRQFWTEERWVRVTDDDANARFVGVNQPVTLEQALGEMEQEQAQQIAMEMGLFQGDPRLQEVIAVRNNVQMLDVDIILEEVPDRVTLEGEVFEALLKYGPTIPPAVLIEADPTLPRQKKEKLLEMMQQANAAQAESPQAQAGMAAMQAEIEKMQSEAMENQANAQRNMAEAQRAAMGF